ncbi:MAG: hypothetical protein JWO50_585 [Candidatus Kaiserbacteria bacterium]|nr:hypothetical protein [Candidatus Kaiserbacteria bacterium]
MSQNVRSYCDAIFASIPTTTIEVKTIEGTKRFVFGLVQSQTLCGDDLGTYNNYQIVEIRRRGEASTAILSLQMDTRQCGPTQVYIRGEAAKDWFAASSKWFPILEITADMFEEGDTLIVPVAIEFLARLVLYRIRKQAS